MDLGTHRIEDDGSVTQTVLGQDAPSEYAVRLAIIQILSEAQKARARSPIPMTKVEVTDEAGYQKLLDRRRPRHLARLDAALVDLERARMEYVSDGAGGAISGDDAKVEALADAVTELVKQVRDTGDRVPLLLPPWARGKIECWQDGEQVLATMRIRGEGGKTKVLTTYSPLSLHVEEVLEYSMRGGADPRVVEAYLPRLAQMLGGGACIVNLCKAVMGGVK